MANDINRSNLIVDFKDIYGTTISDDVEIKIYNTQLMSLKQVFDVSFQGQPVTLPDVPAFPTGHAQMIVSPTKYRFNLIQSTDCYESNYLRCLFDKLHLRKRPDVVGTYSLDLPFKSLRTSEHGVFQLTNGKAHLNIANCLE